MYFNGNLFKCRQRNRNFSSMFSLCFGCSAIWRIVTSHYYCQDVNWCREPVNKDLVVTNWFISSVIAIRSCICNQVNTLHTCYIRTFCKFLIYDNRKRKLVPLPVGTTDEERRMDNSVLTEEERRVRYNVGRFDSKYSYVIEHSKENFVSLKILWGWIVNVGLT